MGLQKGLNEGNKLTIELLTYLQSWHDVNYTVSVFICEFVEFGCSHCQLLTATARDDELVER